MLLIWMLMDTSVISRYRWCYMAVGVEGWTVRRWRIIRHLQLTALAAVATTKCEVCDYTLYAILAFDRFSQRRVRRGAQSETEARRNLQFKDRDRVTWMQSRLIPSEG